MKMTLSFHLFTSLNRLVLLVVCCSIFASASGQVYTLTGKVVDAADDLGLPGAVIVESPSDEVTTSDLDGNFEINVSAESVLTISFVGYATQEVPVQGRTALSVAMKPSQELLTEVVVTALGISREEKSLGYSVSKMDVKTATEIRDPNLVNSMQGKLAGVDITKTSGGPGASSRILIRGNSSIVNNNQPLVVLDGIPIDNTTTGTGGTWGGIDYGSPISDINPDDIESLTVLKGPSAAALYGSRALNGVIVITTKSGLNAKKGWTGALNSNSSVETAYILKEFQDEYGAGTGGKFSFNEDGIPFFDTERPNLPTYAASWGPRMEGQQYIDWTGALSTYSPEPDNYKNFFQTGHTFTNNVSLTHGGKSPVRISLTDLRNRGISPTSTFKRNSVSISNSGDITKKLRYALKGTYAYQRAFNRVNQSNGHNAARNIIMMPRNVSAESMMNFEDENGNENVWYQQSGWVGNPFFTLGRSINYDNRDRVFGNFSLIHQSNEWLSFVGRIGVDAFNEDRHSRLASGSADVPLGQFNELDMDFMEVNSDLLATAQKTFKKKWVLTANVGGSRMQQKRETLSTNASNLIEPGLYSFDNADAANRDRRRLIYERALNAIYGSAQLGYNNFAYLEVTGRNDWSSTLPAENRSYFYPSVSASLVLTEMMAEVPGYLSFAKVRGSIAQVGKDADPYLLEITYDSLNVVGGHVLSSIRNPFPLVNLEPEKKQSYEVGLDLRFFQNRVGIDLTYYQESTTNQVLTSSVSAASGYSRAVVNAGEIENKGIELLLNTTIIKKENFKWHNIINFTRNQNLVVSLNSSGQQEILGDQWRVNVTATPGQPYGTIYGYGIKRDASGTPLLNSDGTYIRTEEQILLGDVNPDWKMGVTNGFEYKRWRLSFLVDIQKGGDLYSATNMYLHGYSGNAAATLEGREEWYASEADREAQGIDANSLDSDGNYNINWSPTGGYEVSGVYAEGTMINGEDVSGQEASRYIDPQVYWSQYAGWTNEIHEPFVYDASYVKLRELGITYQFNEEAFGKKLKHVNLTLSGRNLWLIFSNVPNVDPEASYSNGNGQGVEYATYPITRSIGLNLSANF
jgi:TonB-linked SusC/RagA family outer membrane protein